MSLYKDLRDSLDAVCYRIDEARKTLDDIDDVYTSKGDVDQRLIDAMRSALEAAEPGMQRLYGVAERLYALWDNDADMSDLSALMDSAGQHEEHRHEQC